MSENTTESEQDQNTEWKHFSWLLGCELCGDAAEAKIENGETETFYDGQEVRCCDDDCPATGSIVTDAETPAYVDWHDIIRKDGEWIPNPEWEKYEEEYLLKD